MESKDAPYAKNRLAINNYFKFLIIDPLGWHMD
jgi:hypothetical protein